MAGGKLGYRIFRKLFLKVSLFSLPNLILGREFLKEFIMDGMKYEGVKPETEKLLKDVDYRNRILTAYAGLERMMGEGGASGRAAAEMTELLHSIKQGK
jgi:lipid-A-disaccharide synthase